LAKNKKKKNKQSKPKVEKMLRPYIKHVLSILLAGGVLLGGGAYIGDEAKAKESIDCDAAIEKAIDEQLASRERLHFTGPEETACKLNAKTDTLPLAK
jgi:hypothetical protein